jgi:hypothetical protein
MRQIPKVLSTKIQTNAKQLWVAELVVHLVGFIGVVVLFVIAVIAVKTAIPKVCTQLDNLREEPGLILAACTAGGFVIGRLVGWFRFHVREGIRGAAHLPPQPAVILNVALVIFVVVAAVLLGYETWSLANGSNPPPITGYVRCAAYHQLFLASLTTASIGFIVSNWLWFPTK